MLTEYFCRGNGKSLAFAYFGALVFFAHHVFIAWLKYALNGW